MGKRSNFERVERDFYPTPYEAVTPLIPHLCENGIFLEPCCGDGALIEHLEGFGQICSSASDIMPMVEWAFVADATREGYTTRGWPFITNPPWDRGVLHPIIENLSAQGPTWLLFDADWMHTKQSAPYIPWLRKIVSVGRVKWIPDSKMTGKDNCAWHLFDQNSEGPAVFYGRTS